MQTPIPSPTLAAIPERLPLEQQVARLQALLEATRQVHSTMRVNEVLHQAASILVRELEMEGALFLAPTSTEPLVSYGQVPPAPYSGCHRFPLLSRDHQLIAELIVAPPDHTVFSLYEQDFVEGLALQTAVALENATLHERDLEWARVQQDLSAARSIQQSLLPAAMPKIPGYSIAARSTTCYEVGGDYLDTVSMGEGSHLIVVADVAGKGLASAIVATSFRSALRSLAGQRLPLEELAARMGHQHFEEGNEARRRYVTALFLHLKPESGEIEIVNAGHNPPVLVLPDKSIVMIEASGTPLGMLPGMSYAAQTFAFPAGSKILLYTDGLTEVFCGEEEFGCERLVALFRDTPSAHSSRILDLIWETLASYSLNAPQTDDMTALAICHHDPAVRVESHPAAYSSQQEFVHP